jgi:hypothetical protein
MKFDLFCLWITGFLTGLIAGFVLAVILTTGV